MHWRRKWQSKSTRPQVQKGGSKNYEKIRKIINNNADQCNKELETVKEPIKITQLNCKDKNQNKRNEYQTNTEE